MPSFMKASRSLEGGAAFNTKPPFEPTGTMTVFFTICALTRPSTSVRKSSGRSDQRNPPRATRPPRRCTPSKRVEYTKISNIGLGSGRPGTLDGSNLNDRNVRRLPCASRRQKFVRIVARTSARYWRSTRSSERFSTSSSAASIARSCSAAREPEPLPPAGSKRVLKSSTSIRAKHDDLVRRDARGDHQLVEVVALDLAGEDPRERILEDRVQRVHLHVDVRQRRLDAEV